jgi:hypothetical protein
MSVRECWPKYLKALWRLNFLAVVIECILCGKNVSSDIDKLIIEASLF